MMNRYDDNDSFDEEPTDPFVDLTIVQHQLNSSESVVAQFTGRAQALGYSVDPPKSWMEELERELDDAVVPVDSISFLVDTP